MKKETIRIDGMTCPQCQNRIEQTLRQTAGIEWAQADFNAGTACVSYDETAITIDEIVKIIEKLGYTAADGKERKPALKTAGLLVMIFALYLLVRAFGIGTQAFPLAEAGMDYGMLFIIGLATSLHCAAMCGGINLSQCINAVSKTNEPPRRKRRGGSFALRTLRGSFCKEIYQLRGLLPFFCLPNLTRTAASGGVLNPTANKTSPFVPAALYNGGRIISYTVIGGLAGALGSLVSVSTRFTGLVQLAAGIFMIAMGINMLGIFPALRRFIPRLPNIFARKIDKQKSGGKNPFFIGLLNGLMPCGPLQAMQIYALSTGNPVSGALSMFVFSIGTVPLIAGIGALSSFLSADGRSPAFARRVTQTGAVLVTVMGMTMLSYGLNLSGINLPGINLDFADKAFAARPAAASRIKDYPSGADPFVPVIENGVQLVNSTLNAGRYPPITVQQGIPVRWTIDAPAGSINGCNNSMIIREYGIEHRFKQGENIIEFTPAKKGKFTYSCWMGMIRGTITVVEEGYAGAEDTEAAPVPAGVAIPTENITLAKIAEDGSYQTINTKLHDDGIDSAIIVVQRSLPASWIINNDSADPGNSRLIFPAYYTQINITAGDNIIRLMPSDDFDFSTVDNVFYGYVKVVDDLNEVNIEAIKREAAEHETLIYPDSYFETAASGGCSCCSR